MANFEKIILIAVSLLIVAVLAIGAIVFQQQKAISALAGKAGTAKQPAVPASAEKNSGPPLTEIIKHFSGTIDNISGNQLSISAELTDFSKPKDPDRLKHATGPKTLGANDFEVLAKKITVNTNEKTFFEKKTLAELKVGDVVIIASDKSPYTADTITAEKVTYFELRN